MKKINFEKSTKVSCITKKVLDKDTQILLIYYGNINEPDENIWSFQANIENMQSSKKYDLPSGYISNQFYGPDFLVGTSDLDYASSKKESTGNITIKKLDGCKTGDEISFSINATLVSTEGYSKDKFVKVSGNFTGVLDNKELYFQEALTGEKSDEADNAPAGYNNGRRKSDVTQILNAIGAFAADNNRNLPLNISSETKTISKKAADICNDLINNYAPVLPVDPDKGGISVTDCNIDYDTGYTVSKNDDLTITVSAPLAEDGKTISYTR